MSSTIAAHRHVSGRSSRIKQFAVVLAAALEAEPAHSVALVRPLREAVTGAVTRGIGTQATAAPPRAEQGQVLTNASLVCGAKPPGRGWSHKFKAARS